MLFETTCLVNHSRGVLPFVLLGIANSGVSKYNHHKPGVLKGS
jgi:hypothetical protein